MTLETVLLFVGGLVAAGVFAYRTFSKQSAELKLQRLVLIQDFARSAWLAVEAFAPTTATTVDDKLSAALKKVAETFAAQTGKPLSVGEMAVAKLKVEEVAAKASLGK